VDLPEVSPYGVCVFGAGGLVVGLVGLYAGRRAPGRSGPGLAPALLGLAAVGAYSATTGRPPGLGWPLLALAGLLFLFSVARSERLARVLSAVLARVRSPRWQWAALAVGSPAAAAVLALGAHPQDETSPQGVEPPPHWHLPFGTAVTDRGRDVPLWEAGGGPGPAEQLRAGDDQTLRTNDLCGRAIQVAPGDRSYNCHGWVFTGGRYLLPDEGVEPILQDNAYTPVERPEVGDLAVYRNDRGAVCHSARVWAVAEGGLVLLESKWAWVGRYLHPPDATPFGQQPTYYHSPRTGHLLRGLEGRPPESTHAPQPPESPLR
jgi:hypothetical protein